MAEQNNKEEEFDVFSTEDWEAAFDSADKTVAMLSAERIVEATPAAVIVESLEAVEWQCDHPTTGFQQSLISDIVVG